MASFFLRLQGKFVKMGTKDRVVLLGSRNGAFLVKSLCSLIVLGCSTFVSKGIIWNLWVLTKVSFFGGQTC